MSEECDEVVETTLKGETSAYICKKCGTRLIRITKSFEYARYHTVQGFTSYECPKCNEMYYKGNIFGEEEKFGDEEK